MDFRIRSHSTQPLRPGRGPSAPAARRTAPLEGTTRETRRLASDQQDVRRSNAPLGLEGLEANPDYQALRTQGKLTPDVLSRLKVLSTQPLAEGIDRKALLASALRELADPQRIAQGDRHTCAAAVVQAKLAEDDPAEYLRLLSGLASPAGEVKLANGDPMRRHGEWRTDAGRSLSSDLLQTAFMQYATGSYDSRTDTRATAEGRGKGLYASEQTRLHDALTGQRHATVFGNGPEVLGVMQQALARGQSIPVVLMARDRTTGQLQGHSVLVERIQDGQVSFLDPGGRRRTVSLEAFTARLQSASLPLALVPAPLLKASEGRQGALAGWPDWGGVLNAVTGGIQHGAQAFHDAVVKPAIELVRPIVQPVVEHVLQPIATHVLQPIAEHLLQPVFEHVIRPVWEKTVEAARWVEQNKEMLLGIGAIACAVIPGLQVVALIMAAAAAVDGAKELYEGLKAGDWKRSLQGGAALLAAVATAVGGPLLSKAIGAGATGLARLAGGLSRAAYGLADLADVFDTRLDTATRYGRLLSFLAKSVGGGSAAMGEGFEKAAATFTRVAEKASNYYDRSVGIAKALTSGSLTAESAVAILAGSLSLGGDLNSDHANRENLLFAPGQEKGRKETYQFKSAATYLEQGYAVGKAVASGDLRQLPGALKTGALLRSRIHRDSRNDWAPDLDPRHQQGKEESDRLNRSAEYFEQGHLLMNGDLGAQAKAAWSLGQKGGEDTGFDWSVVPGVPWLQERRKAIENWEEKQGKAVERWTEDRMREAQRWWEDWRRGDKPTAGS